MREDEQSQTVNVQESLRSGRIVTDQAVRTDDLMLPLTLLLSVLVSLVVTAVGGNASKYWDRYVRMLFGAVVLIGGLVIWMRASVRQLQFERLDEGGKPRSLNDVVRATASLGWDVIESRDDILRIIANRGGQLQDKYIVVLRSPEGLLVNVRNQSVGKGARVPWNFGGLRRARKELQEALNKEP